MERDQINSTVDERSRSIRRSRWPLGGPVDCSWKAPSSNSGAIRATTAPKAIGAPWSSPSNDVAKPGGTGNSSGPSSRQHGESQGCGFEPPSRGPPSGSPPQQVAARWSGGVEQQDDWTWTFWAQQGDTFAVWTMHSPSTAPSISPQAQSIGIPARPGRATNKTQSTSVKPVRRSGPALVVIRWDRNGRRRSGRRLSCDSYLIPSSGATGGAKRPSPRFSLRPVRTRDSAQNQNPREPRHRPPHREAPIAR